MTPLTLATALVERLPLPDRLTAAGITALVEHTRRGLDPATEAVFAARMAAAPIAVRPDAANVQHYEVPADFFALVLGPRRKYSSCLFAPGVTSLAMAEEAALAETAAHAALADGQDILELGCGWGSLSLWMAEHYPNARITAVSNSHAQRRFIEAEAAGRALGNLHVITADMNDFAAAATWDRIVSVEMFEHMTNWQALLTRIRGWLRPDGRLFIHVFSHRSTPYRFDVDNQEDWIAQHFFTGGIMPSHGLLRRVAEGFAVDAEWRWSGIHYARTAQAWLDAFDRHRADIRSVLQPVYGRDTLLWMRRWRLFFLATIGLFGHHDGQEWGVSHTRLMRNR